MKKVSLSTRQRLIYLAGFFLSVHYASIAYVNSSLLSQFFENGIISILYIAGSVLSILILSVSPYLFYKYGSRFNFLLFVFIQTIAVVGLGIWQNPILSIIFFLLQQSIVSALYLSMDINMEEITKEESSTGSKRGLYLSIQNTAWILSPLLLGAFVIENDFSPVYLFSGFALFLLFIISSFFENIQKFDTKMVNPFSVLKSISKNRDEGRVMMIQFILNFFYSWMIIYLPLLLSREVGFNWEEIGLILTIMLLPFLLFELPAGKLADKVTGEKEFLIGGLLIMFLSTLMIPMITGKVFILWAIVLFMTRVGASLVEISSESYFFKHIKKEDAGLISVFRMARPLSFIIVPLIALPIVNYFSFSTSFYFLACFTLLGLFFIPKIDTK